jgi:RNA polymerase II-associated factor 1
VANGRLTESPRSYREDAPDAEFSVHLKRENPLPLVPVDPKLLDYPFPPDRHYKYESCSLYRTAQQKLYLSERDVTSKLSLLALKHVEHQLAASSPGVFAASIIDLNKNSNSTGNQSNGFQKQRINWHQRITFCSRPLSNWTTRQLEKLAQMCLGFDVLNTSLLKAGSLERPSGIFHQFKQLADSTLVPNRKEKEKEIPSHTQDDSLEARIRAIEQSFNSATRSSLLNLKHPTNPSLTAAEIFPVFPDFEHWPNQYCLASFDMDPLSKDFARSSDVLPFIQMFFFFVVFFSFLCEYSDTGRREGPACSTTRRSPSQGWSTV